MVQPLGNLFIIAAPSGAGKSSLISAFLEMTSATDVKTNGCLSVSHTTRAPRDGEIDGVHYYFVDQPTFQQMIKDNEFYEYAEVFGNFYGTSKQAINEKLSDGQNVFLDIDWQGARQVKKQNPNVISIFILPPSLIELEKRLVGRGKDSKEVIDNRMKQARSEMSHADEFDYLIVNDSFDEALSDLVSIVTASSLSRDIQSLRYKSLLSELLN